MFIGTCPQFFIYLMDVQVEFYGCSQTLASKLKADQINMVNPVLEGGK